MDSEDDIDPQTADVAALKEYVDDRIESVKQNQERQWMDALKAAGFGRETIENSVDTIASHGMTRRAALGVVAASVFGAGVFTGQASAAPGDDEDTVWGSDTNRSDWYADEIDANKIVATESQYEQGDITGETVVKAYLNVDKTDNTAGNYINIVDTKTVDNLNELDSNFEFSPTETGEYTIHARANIRALADGSRNRLRLQNVTDNVRVLLLDESVKGDTLDSQAVGSADIELQQGKNYAIQVTNTENEFSVLQDKDSTSFTIKRSIVHS